MSKIDRWSVQGDPFLLPHVSWYRLQLAATMQQDELYSERMDGWIFDQTAAASTTKLDRVSETIWMKSQQHEAEGVSFLFY